MRLLMTAALAAVALASTVAIAQGDTLPSADLSVKRTTARVLTAHPGDIVKFRSVVRNNGPAESETDQGYVELVGLEAVSQTCEFVSPDTPTCEYGFLAPGEHAWMVLRLRVTGAVGTTGEVKVCSNSEGTTTDPNPANDCVVGQVRIR
jgi:hypothetical protein